MATRMLVFAVAVLAALALAAPTFADHNAGPCNASGGPGHSDYAQHHIVPLAEGGMLGAGGHIPGSHGGMSLCNPSGR